eukprot:958462-Amphidinium_carterae.1
MSRTSPSSSWVKCFLPIRCCPAPVSNTHVLPYAVTLVMLAGSANCHKGVKMKSIALLFRPQEWRSLLTQPSHVRSGPLHPEQVARWNFPSLSRDGTCNDHRTCMSPMSSKACLL